MRFPQKITKKLSQRAINNSYRKLGSRNQFIDFSSNDYLGLAISETIFNKTHQFLIDNNIKQNGASGSRLLTGNHNLYNSVEQQLSLIHNSDAALIFNSGYDANIGFFSTVPQRGDIILYDEFIHASIRDGIQLSNAKSYKFKHNNLDHLKQILERFKYDDVDIYIVTESVFSMDGDIPNLIEMTKLVDNHKNSFLIIDEAHALGVFNSGLAQELNLEQKVFARIITFGKGLGTHGAVIIGDQQLTDYLINFARSFIYTTGLSPHSLATIKTAYEYLNSQKGISLQEKLHSNIQFFKTEISRLHLNFIQSNSAIHCCIIPGNENVKSIAKKLNKKGFDIKPILSPTVAKGQERLRFCLHAFNSKKEITEVLENLAIFVNQLPLCNK